MLIGYARVSTLYQNLDMQIDALQAAGCEKIFTEKISGKFSERPALDQCLDYLRNDHDVLVVWKLDRLGRSLTHLVSVINGLSERNIGFKTVQGNLDTESSFGKMLFYIMAAFAEFERDLEQERTMCGLESARKRGKLGGRPIKLTEERKRMAIALLNAPDSMYINEIATQLGISASSLYKFHARWKADQTGLTAG